jgi:hypothetical protein
VTYRETETEREALVSPRPETIATRLVAYRLAREIADLYRDDDLDLDAEARAEARSIARSLESRSLSIAGETYLVDLALDSLVESIVVGLGDESGAGLAIAAARESIVARGESLDLSPLAESAEAATPIYLDPTRGPTIAETYLGRGRASIDDAARRYSAETTPSYLVAEPVSTSTYRDGSARADALARVDYLARVAEAEAIDDRERPTIAERLARVETTIALAESAPDVSRLYLSPLADRLAAIESRLDELEARDVDRDERLDSIEVASIAAARALSLGVAIDSSREGASRDL